MQELTPAALPALADCGITIPLFDRKSSRIGVVHLGLGAFHRAHQAVVFDTLLQNGDARWGVLGVAMRTTQLADALAQQQGLYSMQINSHVGRSWQVVGSVLGTCVAAREAQRVIDAIAAPSTRWVTLTVTEKGYGPDLAALLVKGLDARCQAGVGGLTIASCDNLTDNGRKLQSLCLDHAGKHDATLADWIKEYCAFPNSMVDRIVPAATAERLQEAAQALGAADQCAVSTEGFWEWVIEDRFAEPADAKVLASADVQVVADVKPFEQAKLCMLNGSHTAIALMGAVLGLPTVADCVANADIRWFVHYLMTDTMMPQLQRPGLPAYRDALLARFANAELHHKVHQIASDSSLKIPLRWLPTLQTRLSAGADVEPLAFAAAVWMRYLLAEDEQGRPYVISDPAGERLQTLAKQHPDDVLATVAALLGQPAIWGDMLPADTRWTSRVGFWLERIQALGVGVALAQFKAAHAPHA